MQAIPSSWPPPTTREGADELTFLDVTASSSGRATMLDVVQAHRRAGVHPADRRRRCAVGGRRRRAAACGRRQGRGQHRRHRAPGAAAPSCPVSSGRSASCCRSTPEPSRRVRTPTPSGWEVTTHGGRRGTGMDAIEWAARGAELGVGEILLNSMDFDGTKAGFDLHDAARGARGGHRPGHRQRRGGGQGTFRARGCCRCRRRAGRQRVPLPAS